MTNTQFEALMRELRALCAAIEALAPAAEPEPRREPYTLPASTEPDASARTLRKRGRGAER